MENKIYIDPESKEALGNILKEMTDSMVWGDNQYFTPDIEDIRVGYECEWLLAEGLKHVWQARKADWILIQKAQEFGTQFFRVPYLTKEQIEAEGWKFEGGQLVSWGAREFRIDINKHSWYECTLYPDVHNVIITRYDVNGDDDNQLFNGECKDINTFRYICKLLSI